MTVDPARLGPAPWSPPRPLPERCLTPRVEIRWWQHGDAAGMLRALDEDRASYLPWLPWVSSDNLNLGQCIYRIEANRRAREAGEDFTIGWFDRATGQVLGGSGFHRLDPASHTAEIGYWLRPDRRGAGLCTEAVAHMISWGFAAKLDGGWGFRRIVIYCAGGNTASARVCAKLGLRHEVQQLRARWVDGRGWEDTLGWGVLAEEWDGRGHRRVV